ncbi:MAG: hypothetical protein CL402_08805 [Acidiferrobacteraceae bacterium]|nr:hypothetical protein [Acidiferrobacteraceae bacterium]|tara:strand:- start:4476 stop:5408 length:933 start_codon:yes stop_codon:yes gene_type:complete
MKINLVFGFLGSGKTTLIKRHLGSQQDLSRTAVIVNEFGDVGIDGSIISGDNLDIVELNSGCLCCNLKGPMLDAIQELEQNKQIETLLIESSGLAEPLDTLEALTDKKLINTIEIGPILTVVSLAHFEKLSEFLGDFYIDQIHNADALILNKSDLSNVDQIETVRHAVRELNPKADILITQQCDLDLTHLFESNQRAHTDFVTHIDGLKRATNHTAVHRHSHLDSIVIENSNLITKTELDNWLTTLANDIYRVKGYLNLDGQNSLLQYSIDEFNTEAVKKIDKYQMVFIGQTIDRDELKRQYSNLGTVHK